MIGGNKGGSVPMNMIQQIQQFSKMLKGNPKDIVQDMLNSGKLTQDQFNEYAQITNEIMGINNK